MHELGMCQGVLDVGLEAAQGEALRRIRVRAGTRLGLSQDSWLQAWEVATAGTVAEGAEMQLLMEAPWLRCQDCGQSQPISPAAHCSSCGSGALRPEGGDRLVVEEIEVADGMVVRNPELLAETG